MRCLTHGRSSVFALEPNDRVLIGDRPYFLNRVARGGMGCVLLLRIDRQRAPKTVDALGSSIALKAVLPDAAGEKSFALFKRELTIWSGLRHPNVISLLEILDGGDAGPLAAMTWCSGSLREILNTHTRLSIEDSTAITCDIIHGLSNAYERDKVLHLDLKPENVLYDFDLSLRLAHGNDPKTVLKTYKYMLSDWGIASIKQRYLNAIVALGGNAVSGNYTFNNMGTPVYMAPERFAQGTHATLASDVFSLGMMYFEMLIGRLPFREGMNPIQSILSGQYIEDATALIRTESVSSSVGQVILNMLAFAPSDRPANYSSLRAKIMRASNSTKGFFARLLK